MKAWFKATARATGARIQHFFLGGAELEFESSLSPESLKERLRSTRTPILEYSEGAGVSIWGDTMRVCWRAGLLSKSSFTVFRGLIETTPCGSRIRGRISAARFAQISFGLWMGAAALFSLFFVWTIFIPAGGMVMIWIASHMLCDEEDEEKIIAYLTSQSTDPSRGKAPA